MGHRRFRLLGRYRESHDDPPSPRGWSLTPTPRDGTHPPQPHHTLKSEAPLHCLHTSIDEVSQLSICRWSSLPSPDTAHQIAAATSRHASPPHWAAQDPRRADGKGAIDCDDGTVSAWQVGVPVAERINAIAAICLLSKIREPTRTRTPKRGLDVRPHRPALGLFR